MAYSGLGKQLRFRQSQKPIPAQEHVYADLHRQSSLLLFFTSNILKRILESDIGIFLHGDEVLNTLETWGGLKGLQVWRVRLTRILELFFFFRLQ